MKTRTTTQKNDCHKITSLGSSSKDNLLSLWTNLPLDTAVIRMEKSDPAANPEAAPEAGAAVAAAVPPADTGAVAAPEGEQQPQRKKKTARKIKRKVNDDGAGEDDGAVRKVPAKKPKRKKVS